MCSSSKKFAGHTPERFFRGFQPLIRTSNEIHVVGSFSSRRILGLQNHKGVVDVACFLLGARGGAVSPMKLHAIFFPRANEGAQTTEE